VLSGPLLLGFLSPQTQVCFHEAFQSWSPCRARGSALLCSSILQQYSLLGGLGDVPIHLPLTTDWPPPSHGLMPQPGTHQLSFLPRSKQGNRLALMLRVRKWGPRFGQVAGHVRRARVGCVGGKMVQLSEPALLCVDSGSASRRRGYGQLTCRHDTRFSLVLLFLLSLSTGA